MCPSTLQPIQQSSYNHPSIIPSIQPSIIFTIRNAHPPRYSRYSGYDVDIRGATGRPCQKHHDSMNNTKLHLGNMLLTPWTRGEVNICRFTRENTAYAHADMNGCNSCVKFAQTLLIHHFSSIIHLNAHRYTCRHTCMLRHAQRVWQFHIKHTTDNSFLSMKLF